MPQKTLELRGVKTFTGHDGQGLNATLFFKSRKAAFVLDDANGAPIEFIWDRSYPTAEADVLAYCQTLPMPEWSKEFKDFEDPTGYKRLENAVNALADEAQNDKRFKRLCKTKTVFETPALKAKKEYGTLAMPYGPHAIAIIKKQHPDAVFINERYAPTTAKAKAFAKIAAGLAETR